MPHVRPHLSTEGERRHRRAVSGGRKVPLYRHRSRRNSPYAPGKNMQVQVQSMTVLVPSWYKAEQVEVADKVAAGKLDLGRILAE